MNAVALPVPTSDIPSPRLLAAAPHRLLFIVGAVNVLAAMTWWALWLAAARWHLVTMPATRLPAGWLHALVMQYQVLTPFVFGFLLTVFPRWLSLPALGRWHYVPVGLGLFGGQVLTLVGLWGVPHLLYLGLLQTLAGWAWALAILFGLARAAPRGDQHVRSCLLALSLGLVGWSAVVVALASGRSGWIPVAIRLGGFGLLLPIYFTVNHRLIPFFASVVVPGYRMVRPMAALAAFWVLVLAHLALDLAALFRWLWLPDLGLLVLTAGLLWRWYPRSSLPPMMLRVLFIGFAWLPLSFGLYATQSLVLAIGGVFVLGRAPAHALFVGYFGSLLVAMVTRVTQGHSGRVLEFGPTAAFAFLLVQIVAVIRILAEVADDPLAWQAVAAVGWLTAFLPWVLTSARLYLTPRADGRPG